MGWKSTVTISRAKAVELIQKGLSNLSNQRLEDVVESIYGDDPELEYFGNNFTVLDVTQDDERAEYERLKRKFEA